MDQHHPLERGANGLSFYADFHMISVLEVVVEDSRRLQNVDQQIQDLTVRGLAKGTSVSRVYIRSVFKGMRDECANTGATNSNRRAREHRVQRTATNGSLY